MPFAATGRRISQQITDTLRLINQMQKRIVIFIITVLLLLTTGCQHSEDKPLWERLDEAQYNRYKPRLDYMIEKYGEEFTMDNYGTVF